MTGTITLDWPTAARSGHERHLRLELRVTPGEAAVTSGPPDRWAPAEPPEVEVARAWIVRPRRLRELDAAATQDRLEADRAEWDRLVDAAVEVAREQASEAAADAAEARAERARGLL